MGHTILHKDSNNSFTQKNNASSPEAIAKRIKKIAEELYVFEDFVTRDKDERNITRSIQNLKKYEYTPPVVIKGVFRGPLKKNKF